MSSNSFMGKQLPREARQHPDAPWHRVAEKCPTFLFPQSRVTSRSDQGMTATVCHQHQSITDAALNSSIEKELFHGSHFYCMCMNACTKQQGRFLDCKSQVTFFFCLIQSRDFHLSSPYLKQGRDMNAPSTSQSNS